MITKPAPQPKLSLSHTGYFYGMGSGLHTEKNPYALAWRLPNVTEDFIRKHENYGAMVCVRHRPFGETQGGPMDWDQAVTIKNDESWKWLIDEYHKQTEALLSACPGIIVIDYLGKVENQLESRRKEGQYSQLIHRLWGGCQPCLNHKVWLGLDAASGEFYPDGSIYHHFMETIAACKREQGCDVVVEALPRTGAPISNQVWTGSEWSRQQHALCLEKFYYDRMFKYKLTNHFRYTSDHHTTFRVANGHSRGTWESIKKKGRDPLQEWIDSCFENGHNPLFAMPGYGYDDFAQRWASLTKGT